MFTNGTNVISNTCNVIPWAMVASVSDCIVRACTSGISGFSYYMPDGNCIARVCPTHGLYISPNNLYSEYEIYAAVGKIHCYEGISQKSFICVIIDVFLSFCVFSFYSFSAGLISG